MMQSKERLKMAEDILVRLGLPKTLMNPSEADFFEVSLLIHNCMLRRIEQLEEREE